MSASALKEIQALLPLLPPSPFPSLGGQLNPGLSERAQFFQSHVVCMNLLV